MMKAIIFCAVIFQATILSSCKNKIDPVISYEEALKICVPDTMMIINMEQDTMRMPYLETKCIVGAQLPELEALTMDSLRIDSNYFSNKITVLNFWFIGCHPCEAEMPGFNKLVEKYSSQPVQFLAISLNSPKDVEEFLLDSPFNVTHIAYGEPLIKSNFQSKWGYPVTIVADQHQKILYADSGGKDDSTAVEEIQKVLIPVIDGALER